MLFNSAQLETLKSIVAEAAAAEIMPRFRALSEGGIRQKAHALDLVTDADENAEWRMRDAVAKAFPKALFVGEESVARDKTLLSKLAAADIAVIVDPVDGTSNFAWGLPLFGVIAAVTMKGETVAGLIYDPVGQDWLVSLRGEGAEGIAANGARRPLRAASSAPLSEMTGVTSWYLLPEPQRSRAVASFAKVHATFAYRCAAYEYRIIAEGHCHFAFHFHLNPWDHAAGVLIHQEAGGYAALFDGSPYSVARHEGGIISAPDKESWTLLRKTFLG